MMKYYLGIDPDLHNTGIALLDGAGAMVETWCVTIPTKLKGEAAVVSMAAALHLWLMDLSEFPGSVFTGMTVVVEGQEIYRGKTPNPMDILRLGQVAGAAVGVMGNACDRILLPTPNKWKGSVPKHIHQARTLTKLGVDYKVTSGSDRYAYPVDDSGNARPPFPKSKWKHIVDGIGLAQWGLKTTKA
jgi:hypothetical protein